MSALQIPPKPRILVIRRDNIGDLVCTTPALAALRRGHPDAQIAVLVNSYNAEVLRGNTDINKTYVYQKVKHVTGVIGKAKALYKKIKLILRLRFWRPDITILAKSNYDPRALSFARMIGSKNVIGYRPGNLRQSKALPDIAIKEPVFGGLHEVEAVSGLLRPLGILDASGGLRVKPDRDAVDTMRRGLSANGKKIALHISAREVERRWGNHNFIELTKWLLVNYPRDQVLIFWSPGDADDPRHPGDDMSAYALMHAVADNRVMLVPTKNLTELIAALFLCDVFVGADGGAMHLAAGLNKKVLALFENKREKLNHWYPWQVNCRIVHAQQEIEANVHHIELKMVCSAFNDLIQDQIRVSASRPNYADK